MYLDDGACEQGLGPPAVRVEGVCVDSTEVTNAHYQAFLEQMPSAAAGPDVCDWNDSFVPQGWPLATGTEDHPVGGVDWCDANAYCAWAGKRLCGLYVTDTAGHRLGFGRALWRNVAALFSYLTLYIGFFMAGFTGRKQALHLTPQGAAALADAKDCIRAHEAWLKGRFSPQEVEKLVEMLARIHE